MQEYTEQTIVVLCQLQVLVDLAKKVGASKVYCHSEVTYEEDLTEKQVSAALKTEDIQLKACWGSTLFSPDELPFEMDKVPPTHGAVRYLYFI